MLVVVVEETIMTMIMIMMMMMIAMMMILMMMLMTSTEHSPYNYLVQSYIKPAISGTGKPKARRTGHNGHFVASGLPQRTTAQWKQSQTKCLLSVSSGHQLAADVNRITISIVGVGIAAPYTSVNPYGSAEHRKDNKLRNNFSYCRNILRILTNYVRLGCASLILQHSPCCKLFQLSPKDSKCSLLFSL